MNQLAPDSSASVCIKPVFQPRSSGHRNKFGKSSLKLGAQHRVAGKEPVPAMTSVATVVFLNAVIYCFWHNTRDVP